MLEALSLIFSFLSSGTSVTLLLHGKVNDNVELINHLSTRPTFNNEANSHTGNIPSLSLSEQVSTWEARVKEARGKGDPAATIAIASAAADTIELQIDQQADNWTENERAALTTVKRFTYSATADAWPGWELNGLSLDPPALATAKILAQRSAVLVEKLQLGMSQEATGIWLVEAFDLALGSFDSAITSFSTASQRWKAGSASGLALPADGYTVIARGVSTHQPQEEISGDLNKIVARISTRGFKDEWLRTEQLCTAWSVFSKK